MYLSDIHTHSIASGHGTICTISDMAKAASKKGLKLLGITDHGPGTLAAGTSSYFRSLTYAPKKRFGIELLFGVELNILDEYGTVDLEEPHLGDMDVTIASLHKPCIQPGSREYNTQCLISAMKNPHINIIGHPDDGRYMVDMEAVVQAAKEYHTLLELNNNSLNPAVPVRMPGKTIRRCCVSARNIRCPLSWEAMLIIMRIS